MLLAARYFVTAAWNGDLVFGIQAQSDGEMDTMEVLEWVEVKVTDGDRTFAFELEVNGRMVDCPKRPPRFKRFNNNTPPNYHLTRISPRNKVVQAKTGSSRPRYIKGVSDFSSTKTTGKDS